MALRPRRDLDDDLDESLFDREEAARRRKTREEMIASGTERLAQEAVRDAKMRERAVLFTIETNRRAILAEYDRAGVQPRFGQLVSLSLLLQMGWRIEETHDGEKTLVAPPAPARYVPKGECS